MKYLLLLLFLLPLFTFGQAPTDDSTKLTAPPIVGSFTMSSLYYRGGNTSNGQVGYLNTITGKWAQLITGYQFNHYTGTSTQAQLTAITGGYVPNSRTLTINGTAFDLSTNRAWSVGSVTSIATSTGILGGTITSTGTLKADTSVVQTVLNFFPKGDTRWLKSSSASTIYVTKIAAQITDSLNINTYASPTKTIVSLGPSITFGSGAGPYGTTPTNGYAYQVANAYNATLTNLGTPGAIITLPLTTQWSTIPSYSAGTSRYITSQWGANEYAAQMSIGQYTAYYNALIDSLHTIKGYPLATIVVVQMPYICGNGFAITPQQYAAADSTIAAAKGVKFVRTFYRSVGGLTALYDCLHPNNNYHTLIAGYIISLLNDADIVVPNVLTVNGSAQDDINSHAFYHPNSLIDLAYANQNYVPYSSSLFIRNNQNISTPQNAAINIGLTLAVGGTSTLGIVNTSGLATFTGGIYSQKTATFDNSLGGSIPIISVGGNSTNNGQQLRLYNTSNDGADFGYATTLGYYIQGYNAVTPAYKNLILNPFGANVQIGSTDPLGTASLLQVSGDVNITGNYKINGVNIASGTLTTISGVAANGFTWSIANPTTTPAITLTLQNATTSQSGQLTSTDWNTFNGKANALSGTTNSLTKFTSSTTVGNSAATEVSGQFTFGTSANTPPFTAPLMNYLYDNNSTSGNVVANIYRQYYSGSTTGSTQGLENYLTASGGNKGGSGLLGIISNIENQGTTGTVATMKPFYSTIAFSSTGTTTITNANNYYSAGTSNIGGTATGITITTAAQFWASTYATTGITYGNKYSFYGDTGAGGLFVADNSSFGGTLSASNLSGTNTGDETTSRINALYGYTPANGALYLPLTGGILSGAVTFSQTSPTAATVYDGFINSNTTAATSANQQYSSATHFIGQGWFTSGTPGSQQYDWRNYMTPIQSGAGSASMLWDYQVAGGGYTPKMTLTSGGALTLAGGAVLGGGLVAAGAISGVTTLGLSGRITLTDGNNTLLWLSQSATTGYQYTQTSNSGANLRWGIENSTGGGLGTGTDAYAVVIGSAGSSPVNIIGGSGGQVVYAIDGSGNHNFKSGTALFGGNVTAPSFIKSGGTSSQVLLADGTTGTYASGFTFRGSGQTTLVAGTKAISVTGVTTSSQAFINSVSQGGTVSTTFEYAVVCTVGTITITALTTGNVTNTLDTSVVNYFVIN